MCVLAGDDLGHEIRRGKEDGERHPEEGLE